MNICTVSTKETTFDADLTVTLRTDRGTRPFRGIFSVLPFQGGQCDKGGPSFFDSEHRSIDRVTDEIGNNTLPTDGLMINLK